MPGLRDLIREIHRRSIWQVLAIYVGGSWVVWEAIEGISGTAGLPDWVPGAALILILIGLPIVLATAFVQDRPVVGENEGPEDRTVDDAAAVSGEAVTQVAVETSISRQYRTIQHSERNSCIGLVGCWCVHCYEHWYLANGWGCGGRSGSW